MKLLQRCLPQCVSSNLHHMLSFIFKMFDQVICIVLKEDTVRSPLDIFKGHRLQSAFLWSDQRSCCQFISKTMYMKFTSYYMESDVDIRAFSVFFLTVFSLCLFRPNFWTKLVNDGDKKLRYNRYSANMMIIYTFLKGGKEIFFLYVACLFLKLWINKPRLLLLTLHCILQGKH